MSKLLDTLYEAHRDIEEPSDGFIDAHRSDEAKARSAADVAKARQYNIEAAQARRQVRHAYAQRIGDAVHAAVMGYPAIYDEEKELQLKLASVAYTAAVRAVMDEA